MLSFFMSYKPSSQTDFKSVPLQFTRIFVHTGSLVDAYCSAHNRIQVGLIYLAVLLINVLVVVILTGLAINIKSNL